MPAHPSEYQPAGASASPQVRVPAHPSEYQPAGASASPQPSAHPDPGVRVSTRSLVGRDETAGAAGSGQGALVVEEGSSAGEVVSVLPLYDPGTVDDGDRPGSVAGGYSTLVVVASGQMIVVVTSAHGHTCSQ